LKPKTYDEATIRLALMACEAKGNAKRRKKGTRGMRIAELLTLK
jgi:hypothetical protein